MGSNNLILRTNANIAIGAALTGTGTLTIMSSGNTAMGIGTGQTGTVSLTNAELAFITNGWNSVVLGNSSSTAAVNVGAYTWQDNLTLRSAAGLLTINGAQNMGANNLTILTNSDLTINAALTGTGTLQIGQTTASTILGVAGGAGALNLSTSDLGQITNGWNSIVLGTATATGVMNVNAYTWQDALTLQTLSGVITIAGAQNMGANDFDHQDRR